MVQGGIHDVISQVQFAMPVVGAAFLPFPLIELTNLLPGQSKGFKIDRIDFPKQSEAGKFINGQVIYVDGGILANFGSVKGENDV